MSTYICLSPFRYGKIQSVNMYIKRIVKIQCRLLLHLGIYKLRLKRTVNENRVEGNLLTTEYRWGVGIGECRHSRGRGPARPIQSGGYGRQYSGRPKGYCCIYLFLATCLYGIDHVRKSHGVGLNYMISVIVSPLKLLEEDTIEVAIFYVLLRAAAVLVAFIMWPALSNLT